MLSVSQTPDTDRIQWGAVSAELHSLCPLLLDDAEHLETSLLGLLEQNGQSASSAFVKRFSPQGVTLVLVGAQVWVVLHTWPERGQATLDVRGPMQKVWLTAELLSQLLHAAK